MIVLELKLRQYNYKTRKQLSERLAKRYFEKKGYRVLKGSLVYGKENSIHYDEYPNVKAAYDFVEQKLSEMLDDRYLLIRHTESGVPDFILFKDDEIAFAEVKLEHESVNERQKKCIQMLENMGFTVFLIKWKKKPYKIMSKVEDGKKEVLLRQKRFMKNHAKEHNSLPC